ncbi:MAG TPA: hypothetical protein DCK79_01670 [Candidatus Atribacteria bacterium]|nr:hypothetical protein [Candidatus Atribacteria bacterium]
MKKNVLIKGILVLVVIAFLSLAFTGCAPTTGTVYIIVTGGWVYDIYMDYNQKFWSAAPGTYTLFNVPIGTHFFEAIDTWGWTWGYDSATQYIAGGVNYVYLNP